MGGDHETKATATDDDDDLPICDFCGAADAAFQCSSCKKAFYCNAQCQLGGWAAHHLVCAQLKAAPETPKKKSAPKTLDNASNACQQPQTNDTCGFIASRDKPRMQSKDDHSKAGKSVSPTAHKLDAVSSKSPSRRNA